MPAFEIVPFNPARHGTPIESFRASSRTGIIFLLIGIVMVVAAVLLYAFAINGVADVAGGIWAGFWIALAGGAIFMVIGLYNILDVRDRNAVIRRLQQPGQGRVTRGTVKSVRNTYKIFGRTPFTSAGDMMGGAETGWFFQVTYVFEDASQTLRTATGVIPDLVGPKRRQMQNNTFLDPNMPRAGQHVDVLFDVDDSAMLRLVPAT